MNNFKRIVRLFVALVVLIFACCSPLPVDSSAKVRIFSIDYDRLFTAVLDYCSAKSYPVVTEDKLSGLIVTDFCPHDPDVFFGRKRNKLNFTLRQNSDGTTTMTAQYTLLSGLSEEYDRYDKSTYDILFHSIENFLK